MADLEALPKTDTETTPLLVARTVEKHEDHRKARRNLALCIFLFVLVAGGVVCVKFIEGWQVITSLYVIVQIVTTIGYGDFTVTSDRMKLFCSFYVLLIWVFGAYAFNSLFSWVQNHTLKVTRKKLQVFQEKHSLQKISARATDTDVSALGEELIGGKEDIVPDYTEFVAASFFAFLAIAFGTVFYGTFEACTCSYGVSYRSSCKDDTYELCIETGGYQKNWITAFYMSVITLTTVGFGDHSPRSLIGRCVGSVWMLIGVGFMARWFSTLAKLFFDYEQTQRLAVTHELSEDLFKQIDQDGSGSLSRSEFTNYFLVRNGLITWKDLEEINQHFDRLDSTGRNSVTWSDIKHHS